MKIILKRDILEANTAEAEGNRRAFREHGVFVVNLMSSPGSGKTTLLEKTLERLGKSFRMAVIEGDLYTSHDAERIEGRGVPVVQINTEGGCHLDARMVAAAMAELDLARLDLLFIENVGNLVCPAAFDLGEDLKVIILSTTEGNDKVVKYPIMFRDADVVILNKADLLPHVDFDVDVLRRDLGEINPEIPVFTMSAKTGSGVEAWCRWLEGVVRRGDRAVENRK